MSVNKGGVQAGIDDPSRGSSKDLPGSRSVAYSVSTYISPGKCSLGSASAAPATTGVTPGFLAGGQKHYVTSTRGWTLEPKWRKHAGNIEKATIASQTLFSVAFCSVFQVLSPSKCLAIFPVFQILSGHRSNGIRLIRSLLFLGNGHLTTGHIILGNV